MIKYYCDRCGLMLKDDQVKFTVRIEPPTVWQYYEGPVKYYSGEMHFCQACMEQIQECIDELGRNDR